MSHTTILSGSSPAFSLLGGKSSDPSVEVTYSVCLTQPAVGQYVHEQFVVIKTKDHPAEIIKRIQSSGGLIVRYLIPIPPLPMEHA